MVFLGFLLLFNMEEKIGNKFGYSENHSYIYEVEFKINSYETN